MDNKDTMAEDNRATSVRLRFDPKARFPAKLYSVANDNIIITWNKNGTSILVEENSFEENVMTTYPGFVQIASFLNFRRLFREYSFDWRVVDGTDSVFEFSHLAFRRDRPDILDEITTKRKSTRYRLSTNNHGKRRCRRRLKGSSSSDSSSDTFSEISSSEPWVYQTDCTPTSSCTASNLGTYLIPSPEWTSPEHHPEASVQLYSSSHVRNALDTKHDSSTKSPSASPLDQQDLQNILAMFAQNELTEEEHFQLIANAALCCVENSREAPRESTRETIFTQTEPLSTQEFVPLGSHEFVVWKGEAFSESDQFFMDINNLENNFCNERTLNYLADDFYGRPLKSYWESSSESVIWYGEGSNTATNSHNIGPLPADADQPTFTQPARINPGKTQYELDRYGATSMTVGMSPDLEQGLTSVGTIEQQAQDYEHFSCWVGGKSNACIKLRNAEVR